MRKVWIEVALNGPWGRARQPGIPVAEAEIIADGIACAEAGAAVIHLHAYDAATGRQRDDWQIYARIIEGIRARVDAIVYPTIPLAGSAYAGAEGDAAARFAHVEALAARGLIEWTVVDPGSVNFVRFGAEAREGAGFVYLNPPDHVAEGLRLATRHRLHPSYAIYEPGFLRTVMAYRSAGRLPAGGLVKLYFSGDDGYMGAPFGLPPTATGLAAYREILGDSGLPWAASLVGGDLGRSGLAELAVAQGGHLHVGIEFYGGDRRPTNVELVAEAAELCARQGRPVATPDEAAAILGLPRPRPGS